MAAHHGDDNTKADETAPLEVILPKVGVVQADQIGPYKLLGQIGEGGFGIVYLAERTETCLLNSQHVTCPGTTQIEPRDESFSRYIGTELMPYALRGLCVPVSQPSAYRTPNTRRTE